MVRHKLQEERGVSMVEAALILPVLILLLFGIVEFGRAFNAQVTLTHAAREGVRDYALDKDLAAATAKAEFAASGLDPALMIVTATPCVDGQQTELIVQYPFSYDIPFFGARTIDMEGKGVMRCTG
jgi:Flp pilus assembly protein TadG